MNNFSHQHKMAGCAAIGETSDLASRNFEVGRDVPIAPPPSLTNFELQTLNFERAKRGEMSVSPAFSRITPSSGCSVSLALKLLLRTPSHALARQQKLFFLTTDHRPTGLLITHYFPPTTDH